MSTNNTTSSCSSSFLVFCLTRTFTWLAALALPAATVPMTLEMRNCSSVKMEEDASMGTMLEVRMGNEATLVKVDLQHAGASKTV